MNPLPEGTLTFLLTDLEGSTRTWEANPAAMRTAMEQHDALVQAAVEANAGVQVEAGREGDSVLAVFRRASAAAACALELQRSIGAATWPADLELRIRVALHTGEAQLRGAHYFGPALNRCARLLALGHGGQVLLSTATHELLADELPPRAAVRDLGAHRLKDLTRPERVYQLVDLEHPVEFPPLRSGRGQGNNLPLQLTTFVGRAAELQELRQLQSESRLLTITGPGGLGKTRLAVELATKLAERWDETPDGVWFVDLAPVSDPAVVPRAVAAALDVEEQTGRPVEETLADHCAEREMVLVLDNCEHLVDRCAALAERLLRAGPSLHVIATSREPLRIPGEVVWRVPALAAAEATRLFGERAQAGNRGFQVNGANAETVARICARLDGMPLAIELAAAQLAMMPVEEVAARLEDGLPLAAAGSRTALPRQQTLEALIDWSHRLLDPAEAVLFRRLSVFAGDFSLSAAEAVGAGSDLARDRVVPVLSELVAKSLVQPVEGRYRCLETIRAFAEARLASAGEADTVRERHARHYLELAASWTPGERAAWLDRLEADHENLRAALVWAAATDPELAARLGSAMYDFWYLRGYVSEGRQYLGTLLAALPPAAAGRRQALLDAAGLAYVAGDLEQAVRLLGEGLGAARAAADMEALARGLVYAGAIGIARRDAPAAGAALQEGLAVSRRSNNRRAEAEALHQLGMLATLQPDIVEARALFEASLAVRRAMRCADESITTLTFLGAAAMLQGETAAARAAIVEALEVGFALRDRRVAWSLDVLACLAALEDRHQHALEVSGAAAGMFAATGQQPPDTWRLFTEPMLARARQVLGPEAARLAWEAGRGLSFDDALSRALEGERVTA